jgi:hypothetical protein
MAGYAMDRVVIFIFHLHGTDSLKNCRIIQHAALSDYVYLTYRNLPQRAVRDFIVANSIPKDNPFRSVTLSPRFRSLPLALSEIASGRIANSSEGAVDDGRDASAQEPLIIT